MEEKNEVFSTSQGPGLSSIKISGDLSLAAKKRLQNTLETIFQGWQKAGFLLPRNGICHPMPPHGYGPGLKGP